MIKGSRKIKLLIVEDSSAMQHILAHIFSADLEIEVVGLASDPYIARDLIKSTNPDVLTLDIEMPRMDGITFLKNLMRLNPLPVIMLSSFTEKGSQSTLQALALGAVDYMKKPTADELTRSNEYANELIAAVKNAMNAKVGSAKIKKNQKLSLQEINLRKISENFNQYIIGMGASTGGIEAIERVLKQLPTNLPGIVIVQHIQYDFSLAFVARLNDQYRFIVSAAEEGLEIKPGNVIIATGGHHVEVIKLNNKYYCKVKEGEKVSGHCPSVDVLFESIAQAGQQKALGILLTGMGQDGARGLKAIKEAGGETIAQDEETSIVWGMPGYAVSIGAAKRILPIDLIGSKVTEYLYGMGII